MVRSLTTRVAEPQRGPARGAVAYAPERQNQLYRRSSTRGRLFWFRMFGWLRPRGGHKNAVSSKLIGIAQNESNPSSTNLLLIPDQTQPLPRGK